MPIQRPIAQQSHSEPSGPVVATERNIRSSLEDYDDLSPIVKEEDHLICVWSDPDFTLIRITSDLPSSDTPEPVYNEPRFKGDLYTPRYVRGTGMQREGLCPICFASHVPSTEQEVAKLKPPDASHGAYGCVRKKPAESEERWYRMKVSAYWYHMIHSHGISPATGKPFDPPEQFRINPEAKKEGKCSRCQEWIALDSPKQVAVMVEEIYWYKHAVKCQRIFESPVTKLTAMLPNKLPRIGVPKTRSSPGRPLSETHCLDRNFKSFRSFDHLVVTPPSVTSSINHQVHHGRMRPTGEDHLPYIPENSSALCPVETMGGHYGHPMSADGDRDVEMKYAVRDGPNHAKSLNPLSTARNSFVHSSYETTRDSKPPSSTHYLASNQMDVSFHPYSREALPSSQSSTSSSSPSTVSATPSDSDVMDISHPYHDHRLLPSNYSPEDKVKLLSIPDPLTSPGHRQNDWPPPQKPMTRASLGPNRPRSESAPLPYLNQRRYPLSFRNIPRSQRPILPPFSSFSSESIEEPAFPSPVTPSSQMDSHPHHHAPLPLPHHHHLNQNSKHDRDYNAYENSRLKNVEMHSQDHPPSQGNGDTTVSSLHQPYSASKPIQPSFQISEQESNMHVNEHHRQPIISSPTTPSSFLQPVHHEMEVSKKHLPLPSSALRPRSSSQPEFIRPDKLNAQKHNFTGSPLVRYSKSFVDGASQNNYS